MLGKRIYYLIYSKQLIKVHSNTDHKDLLNRLIITYHTNWHKIYDFWLNYGENNQRMFYRTTAENCDVKTLEFLLYNMGASFSDFIFQSCLIGALHGNNVQVFSYMTKIVKPHYYDESGREVDIMKEAIEVGHDEIAELIYNHHQLDWSYQHIKLGCEKNCPKVVRVLLQNRFLFEDEYIKLFTNILSCLRIY